MSVRNFERVFTREVGTTPSQYVLQMRVEAAPAARTHSRRVETGGGRGGFWERGHDAARLRPPARNHATALPGIGESLVRRVIGLALPAHAMADLEPSLTVSQRTQEIGLRMAIGASPGDVQRMILKQATTLGLLGIGVGVCLTGAGTAFMSSLAPNLAIPTLTAAAATTLLFIVVLVAAWWPARRAAKTEPTMALRVS